MYQPIWEPSQTPDHDWHVIRAKKSLWGNDFFQDGKVKMYANMCKKILSTPLIFTADAKNAVIKASEILTRHLLRHRC